MASKWNLAGTYFEACPCVFASPPTAGECTALVGWHIDSGSFGDTTLDGRLMLCSRYTPLDTCCR
ncbi:MAG: DUF1326 domain-containing protein [Thermodesulfobacteriota bacterium]